MMGCVENVAFIKGTQISVQNSCWETWRQENTWEGDI